MSAQARDLALVAFDFQEFLKHCVVSQTGLGKTALEPWGHFSDARWSSPHGERLSFHAAVAAGRNVIINKARQLGMTTEVAALVLWLAMYHYPDRTIGVFSKGQNDADEFLAKIKSIYYDLPERYQMPLKGNVTMYRFEFEKGGRILSFPATPDAGRGMNPALVVLDEFAHHPTPEASLEALLGAHQIIIMSTANGGEFLPDPSQIEMIPNEGNLFGRIWMREWLDAKGNYTSLHFPWHVRPERPDQTDSGKMVQIQIPCQHCHREGCEACQGLGYIPNEEWRQAERKAKLAGEFPRMRSQLPLTPADSFASKKGLMFPQYDESKHVVAEHPFALKDCIALVVGVDWGGSHDPTAMTLQGMNAGGHIHQFAEYRVQGRLPPVSEMSAWIHVWHRQRPIHGIFCDPHGGNSRASLNEELWTFGLWAENANANRELGLTRHAEELEAQRLTIHASCQWSRYEYSSYYAMPKKNPWTKETFLTDTGVDHHADLMDARRYALLPLVAMRIRSMSGDRSLRDTRGRRLARKAV